MDLYIYYRVRSEHAETLRAQAAAMQQCLSREYGIVTGLKRRPEERDGRQTWMEIYQSVPNGFAAILERAIAQAGLASLIDGQRHTEYFLDVPTCA
ncbi:DUF4936 family protein [Noviherbaspirillum sp. UKPF54]|uniref:DUF4936 family protein n=1 Tax=Noviherbaspirillum sp. UKPF54 TaxID=2601898 RepID=UPI0011B1032E|nr:DUF4936 family protein [Noviherbaspirillum sp. UKPF54]QDZ27649.1 DUF4936 family protein [Noviherbaspirillum sp. UKPF54]